MESNINKAWAGVLALVFMLLALWTEWVDFFLLWNDSIIYHHGFLVAGGTLFLLYLRRHQLAKLKPSGSPLAFFFLITAVGILIVSQAADVRVFRLLLAPVIIVLWGWAIWGFHFVKIAGGPILLLIFAAPIWDDFSPVLQHITVFFNQILLQFADIPATIEEFFIILDVGTFLVEDGCSGVRYLMVALFLAAFYGELYYPNYRRIALLVAIAGLLSMLANWIRVFGIIVAGHYTNMETSLVDDHELFGWIVFVLFTLLPLYFIAPKLEHSGEQQASPASDVINKPKATKVKVSKSAKWPITASIILLVPSILPFILAPSIAATGNRWSVDLPALTPQWQGPLTHADFWQPHYLSPDIKISGVYVSEDLSRVQLQVTGYRTQGNNKELVAYDNKLFHPKQWVEVQKSTQQFRSEVLKDLTLVNEIVISSRQRTNSFVVIWYWYQVGNHYIASRTRAKLAGGVLKLMGDNRGALWAIATPCNNVEHCQRTRPHLEKFLRALSP